MTNTNDYRNSDRLRIDDKRLSKPSLATTSNRILLALIRGFRKRCWMMSVVIVALVSGCATSSPILDDPEGPKETIGPNLDDPDDPKETIGPKLVLITEGLLGLPYTYGGSNEPDGFDCSGLVQYVHSQVGISVPRTARAQFSAVKPVNFSHLQPGDLVFFQTGKQHVDRVDHVGIFAGNEKFIHAPSTGKKISYSLLNNSYWKKRLVGAGRFY